MPRACTVCTHPERAAIDLMLVNATPFRNIAGRFGTSLGALTRHKAEHLPAHLAQAREAEVVAQADSLLDQLRSLQTTTLRVLDKAEKAGSFTAAVLAIKEARGNLELMAKMMGELDDRPQVNVLVAPEWLAIRAALVETLADHPDARVAVVERLAALGAG